MIPLPILTETHKTMIEQFQCPGCVCGHKTDDCSAFKLEDDEGMFKCSGHVPGTTFIVGNSMQQVILGLPRGFHRLGPLSATKCSKMRMWTAGHRPPWDKYNVPVWAMVQEHEGKSYLFARTFMPRNNYPIIDVVEGGTLDMCPGAINVGEFYDEIE